MFASRTDAGVVTPESSASVCQPTLVASSTSQVLESTFLNNMGGSHLDTITSDLFLNSENPVASWRAMAVAGN